MDMIGDDDFGVLGLDALDGRVGASFEPGDLDKDWQAVMAALPVQWQDKARDLGAVRRRLRNFADVQTLLRVLLIHLADGCSLRQAATRAHEGNLVDISAVALFKRLRGCAAWFEWMTRQLHERSDEREHADWPQQRIRLIDGTTVSEPGAKGATWRLHYAFNLNTMGCDEVHLTDASVGESLVHYSAQAGDVLLADRCYANHRGVAHILRQGADVVLRIGLKQIPLHDHQGQPMALLERLRKLDLTQLGSWDALIKPKKPSAERPVLKVRICAYKKTAQQTRISIEEIEREAKRKHARVRDETLEAAGYVIVLTTLQEPSAQQIMELYRRRWQVELAFKRMKSLLELARLKKKDAQGAKAWLQGKLLVATLIDTLIHTAERVSPWGHHFAGHAPALPLARV